MGLVAAVTVLLVASTSLAVVGAAQSTGRITGEVEYQDGTPAGTVDVDVVDTDAGTVAATVTTSTDGSFGPEDLPADVNYTARVDRPGVEDHATRVHLQENESKTIQVVLENVTGELRGTVTDADDDPVAGLEVELRIVEDGTVERTVTTGSGGSYGPVEVPANANYTAVVDSEEWNTSAPTVGLAPNGTEVVDASVERTVGELSVNATDADGDSIAGVTVEIVDEDTGSVAATNETDADGTTGPVTRSPGNYTARIADSGWRSTAETVHLEAGGTATITLDGTRRKSTLTGEVTNASGDPLAGATVTVRNATDGTTVLTLTAASTGGWGPVRVDAGLWTVHASAAGYRNTNRTVRATAGNSTAVALTLHPTAGIRINTTDTAVEDGTLTATVTLQNRAAEAREGTVTLAVDGSQRAERTVSVAGGEPRTVTLATDLDDGTYTVTLAAATESVTTSVVGGDETPTASATPSTATDAAGTATGTQTDAPTGTAPTTTEDGAGFGAALAVLAVLGGLAVAGRPRG